MTCVGILMTIASIGKIAIFNMLKPTDPWLLVKTH